jgi:septal ring factor EnvC (AmiA/AmiB activator)
LRQWLLLLDKEISAFMTDKSCILICLLTCLLLVRPPLLPADTTTGEEIKQHKIHIGKLRQEIHTHLDKIKKSGEKEVSLLDELESIDERLMDQKQKIITLQERLRAQEQLLAMKEKDLQQAGQTKENVRQHLEKRLRAFYLMGKTGFLNVSFSTKTLPELMLFNDSFKEMLSYDQSVINMYRDTIAQLQRARDAQKLEKSLLQDFIRQTKEERDNLVVLRKEKETLLHSIRTRKSLYEQALREMEKAEIDLTKTLTSLKQKEENRIRGFVLSKGKLRTPVNGRIITSFGERKQRGWSKGKPSRGLTIATDTGAKVYAVYSGQIIFTGYMRGYGNMVIIDHGVQHYTVTARLDTIEVKKGDQVQTGQCIGTTGDIATLFEKGLYFEIRHGNQPLDPSEWLLPDQLASSK